MKLVLKITLGILLAGVLLIGGCAALVGTAANEVGKEIDREQKRNAITHAEAKAVPMGTSIEKVKEMLGAPRDTQEMESEGFAGGRYRHDCIYYNIEGGEFMDSYQLCFEDGRLRSRNRF